MKERELRQIADCKKCGKPFGHTGLPVFWRVTVERHGVDLRAVRRQDGLAQFMGNAALAQVMGPDEEMTKPMMQPVTLTLCETCALEEGIVATALLEAEKKDAANG